MKNYRYVLTLATVALFVFACSEKTESTDPESVMVKQEEPSAIKMQNLMKETLALAENLEVIMSVVELPQNTTLPKHLHPGEEFAYIVEGSGTVLIDGQENRVLKAGDSGMIPFKHHHTFQTTDEAVKMVVFRVHEKGQPERELVEE